MTEEGHAVIVTTSVLTTVYVVRLGSTLTVVYPAADVLVALLDDAEVELGAAHVVEFWLG